MDFCLHQFRRMKYKLVLASGSSRRQQIMQETNLDFTVRVKEVPEDFPDALPSEEVAEYLARKKGAAYQAEAQPDEIIITADTTVVVDQEVLNKPTDYDDAVQMLNKLSARQHQVITGVCLTTSQWQRSFSCTTQVIFRRLTDQEIAYYVDRFQPYDNTGVDRTSRNRADSGFLF